MTTQQQRQQQNNEQAHMAAKFAVEAAANSAHDQQTASKKFVLFTSGTSKGGHCILEYTG